MLTSCRVSSANAAQKDAASSAPKILSPSQPPPESEEDWRFMTETMRTMWSEWESVRGELRDQLVEAGAERRRLTEEVRPKLMMAACLRCHAKSARVLR